MKYFFFILFSLCFIQSKGQDVSFSGKWEATLNDKELGATTFSLQISKPENKILFPAQLEIKSDSFNATYHLLLIKKNNRQLGISKNKFAMNESPFSIGNWTLLLNGLLNFNKNSKGQSFLKLERIETKKFGIPLMENKGMIDTRKKTANSIFNILQNSEIILYKTNNQPWDRINPQTITQTKLSPTYFSIYDTLFVNDKEGKIVYNPNKDNDIISIVNNNDIISDQIDSKKKRPEEFFSLDTGLNILVIFADDFGSNAPSGASTKVAFDNITKNLDFNLPENLGATFIAQKIYRKYIAPTITTFQNYPNDNDIDPHVYPIKPRKIDSLTKRINKDIGGITTQSAKLTFSYWDNAVEDGDSISIIINDKWVARGLFVRNQEQYLTVSLSPGPNMITFIADNLGSIVPNTSVIEIIDGIKRKSYFLQTDLSQNNMIKVFYDVQGK